MKQVRPIVLVAIATTLVTGCQNPASAARSAPPTTATTGPVQVVVTATVDGDTFRANYEGRSQRIRILGINAPELSHDGRPEQCGGTAARTALDTLIWHKTVTLTPGPGSDDHDQYGRPLRYVTLGDLDVGLVMIQQGRASEYHPRSASPETRMAAYVSAQHAAEQAHRGQWATCSVAEEGKK